MKSWHYLEKPSKTSLFKENQILSKLLAIRNIKTKKQAELFLNPDKIRYLPFSVFFHAQKAIDRISSAIENNEKIIVYGDFDTDGVTSTAIMYKILRKIGANVDYYLPDRDSESHGLNSKAIVNFIAKQKAKLIITVDCGISNIAEVKLSNSFHVDVIITDHHEAPEILPDAFAIINPKAQGALTESLSPDEIDSLCCLSGAGIAFKLAMALSIKFNIPDFISEIEPIAALGTIGDIVPLRGENRKIAYCGIKAIKSGINKGITKLFQNAGLQNLQTITSETIAFTAVPRINATGRLEKADIAFRLLISDDDDEINDITNKLNEINLKRQKMCEDSFQKADEIVRENPNLFKHSIVIFDEEAHVGIIGLTASKLVEKYTKPAFVMKKDGNMFRCSCRGLKGVNIFNILNENSQLFEGYGGHEFAGGFSFDEKKVSFEKVREAINKSVFEQTNGQLLPDILNIDLKLCADEINDNLVETVKLLEPFGADNPMPVFSIEDATVYEAKFIGQNKNHLKLLCKTVNGDLLDCIKWSVSDFDGQNNDKIKIAFSPEFNEFNGRKSVQLLVKDFILPDLIVENNVKIIDCRTQEGGFDKVYDFLQRTKKSVSIFAENSKLTDACRENGINDSFLFTRDFIPKNKDMIILAETPPSLDFIKQIINSGTKEILFMHYNSPSNDCDFVISKIAGMLKYVYNSLGGQTVFYSFRNALNFDETILNAALSLLSEIQVIDYTLSAENILQINKFNQIKKDELKNNENYLIFKNMYQTYLQHVNLINNSTLEELKKYILS